LFFSTHHFFITKGLLKYGANLNYQDEDISYYNSSILKILYKYHLPTISNLKFMIDHDLKINIGAIITFIKKNKVMIEMRIYLIMEKMIMALIITYNNNNDDDGDCENERE